MFSRLKAVLRPFRLYRAAGFCWHFFRDPLFRRDHMFLWRSPEKLFQHRSITRPDRYPGIFQFVRDRMIHQPPTRLLSFGCATGEEVFTLRSYFPQAFIKGIDINPANIAACHARHRAFGADPDLAFELNGAAANEPADNYDAVFCLAVFQRWQLKVDRAIATCVPHLRFAEFEQTVGELAAAVKPRGFFVLRHSMFRFADTTVAADFSPLFSRPAPKDFFPRFGRDNLRLPDPVEEEVVFQKLTKH